MSPKALARVLRFHAAVQRMQRSPRDSLLSIALDAGYADQPHMNRDFRAFAGISPGRWLAEEHAMHDRFAGSGEGAGRIP